MCSGIVDIRLCTNERDLKDCNSVRTTGNLSIQLSPNLRSTNRVNLLIMLSKLDSLLWLRFRVRKLVNFSKPLILPRLVSSLLVTANSCRTPLQETYLKSTNPFLSFVLQMFNDTRLLRAHRFVKSPENIERYYQHKLIVLIIIK